MITSIVGVALYIIIHCSANNESITTYVKNHWMMLSLVAVACAILLLLPQPAVVATLTALGMPIMAGYSIPSLMTKAGKILAQVRAMLHV